MYFLIIASITCYFQVEEVLKKKKEENDEERNRSNDDDMLPREADDHSSDMFDSIRKSTTIRTEEELLAAVASMSFDQKEAYDRITENALHLVLHRKQPPQCTCDQFRALKNFVFGGPGCGKSYLIKVLMGFAYVETEVKKNPMHFLLGAPTGKRQN